MEVLSCLLPSTFVKMEKMINQVFQDQSHDLCTTIIKIKQKHHYSIDLVFVFSILDFIVYFLFVVRGDSIFTIVTVS